MSSDLDTAGHPALADNVMDVAAARALGQQAAARLRAAVPTLEAKRAAFAALADSADLSNELQRSVTQGFSHVNDPEVLEAFIEPYFAAIEDIWNSRSYKLAEFFAIGLYPAALVSPELVAATNAWLETHPSIPALRRLVIENVAGVERSIRAQERDRAEP